MVNPEHVRMEASRKATPVPPKGGSEAIGWFTRMKAGTLPSRWD
jgi:hypothetical protein